MMQKSEEKTKKLNISRVCIIVLLANAFIRLIMLRHISNPIELILISTGVTMLSSSIIMLFLESRKSELITAIIIASSIGLDVMLYRVLSPLDNPFLWVSVLSLLIVGTAIYIEENGVLSNHSISPKKIASLALVAMFLYPFVTNVQLAHASVVYDHANLTSANGKFQATVYVWKHESAIDGKFFFGFDVLLHTDSQAFFDLIEYLELYVPLGTFDDWGPPEGMTTGCTISVTPSGPAIGISLPLSDVHLYGEYTDTLRWLVNPLPLGENPRDLRFAAKLWTTNSDIQWRLSVKAWSGLVVCWPTPVWVYMWDDQMYYSTIPVPPSRGGGGKCYCM